MQSLSSIIWSTYTGGVLIAWIVLLLVIPDGLDNAGLWFTAALGLGFPLSILLMFIYPYLSPQLEAWIERDIERLEKLWRSLSQWRARRAARQKGQAAAPGGIGDSLPD